MPLYVYAQHDFAPEREDELSFKAGERIEVLEKDDEFNDGWWQGRTPDGQVGLFPGSYTAPTPPPSSASSSTTAVNQTATHSMSVLQPLTEESESESPGILSPVPKPPPSQSFLSNNTDSDYEPNRSHFRDDTSSLHLASDPNGEAIQATMTDVQKAIEQLGRGAGDDGARSFSFSSTRDGAETDETDFDLSDLDNAPSETADGEDWHRNARAKLAAKAKRAVEEAEKLEAMMNGDSSARRAIAPPIEAELSDESDGEEGEYTRSKLLVHHQQQQHTRNAHNTIEEEDEDLSSVGHGAGGKVNGNGNVVELGHTKEDSRETETVGAPSETSATADNRSSGGKEFVLPPKVDQEDSTATATKTSFTVFSPPPPTASTARRLPSPPIPSPRAAPASPAPVPTQSPPPEEPKPRAPSPARVAYPTPITPAVVLGSPGAPRSPTPGSGSRRNSVQQNGLPSPSPSTHFQHAKHLSMRSTSSAPGLIAPTPPPVATSASAPESSASVPASVKDEPAAPAKKVTPPSEWSVEEVVEWLKSKKFDQDVCDKFTEQEITGDVLLELDVNLLKTEIGIMAFGKRMRIANAITDLRRPPSIQYSDHQPSVEHPPSPSHFHLGHSHSHAQMHTRTLSQSAQSHHSFPGTLTTGTGSSFHGGMGGYGAQPSHSNLPSPMGYGYPGQFGPLQEDAGRPSIDLNEPSTAGGVAGAVAAVGLGIALVSPPAAPDTPPSQRTQPKSLLSSPSDSALKSTAAKAGLSVPPAAVDEEDRGHMSDGDVGASNTSVRRRLFGRSHESSVSIANTRTSKDSPVPSPTVQTHDKDKGKEKEKGDAASDKRDSIRDSASIGSGRHRPKRSVEVKSGGERLSIFGSTFGGSLGKSRKPPPSSTGSTEEHEKTSKFSLPRLHSTSMRKASANSQRTPNGSPRDSNVAFSKEDADKKEDKDSKSHSTLRKRTASLPSSSTPQIANGNGHTSSPVADNTDVAGASGPIKQGQDIMEQIGEPDYAGWMRKKGDKYNTWKLRYCILKGPHLYVLRSNKGEKRLKGYVHIRGYKVTIDENIDPGRYGFRIDHDYDKTHFFSSEEKAIIREWMKAIMKATIGRDYSKPVVSSCNIPTIPLVVAQAMNPAPRPPSPLARDATQKAMRRDNPDQLSTRDARVLMGIPPTDGSGPVRLDSFFAEQNTSSASTVTPMANGQVRASAPAPPRPSREMRRSDSQRTSTTGNAADELALIDWANSHLPESLQVQDPYGPLCSGLALLRLAEAIKGKPASPPVPENSFPADARDDRIEGLFRLFDFLLENDVKMGSVSINDIRQAKRDKVLQVLKALKAWEDKRKAIESSFGRASTAQAGGFMVPVVM